MIFGIIKISYIILYVIIINLIGFGVMAVDKYKSQKKMWRISEKTLFFITLIGGGIGTISGMYLFRHKTKKIYFTVGFPAILILQVVLIIYFLSTENFKNILN